MKRKIILALAMLSILMCLMVISISASEMANYCDVQLTFTDGSTKTAYCAITTNDQSIQRDNLYISTDTSGGTYSWKNVKIFDMRNSTVVGSVTPKNYRGVSCNYDADNCEEYYFHPDITEILNATFTYDWKSLKKVYLPKSLITINANSFENCPLEQVIFEDGCALESIGKSAFHGCSNLSTIDFPESLKSIDYNCFYQSGLSGTIVIPNSVTYLGPGSLLTTKIETLILGDGIVEIGHNFAGNYNTVNNEYLKNVYIPAEATFVTSGSSLIFYKCKNPVNFYIVGENCDSVVAALTSQKGESYMNFILATEATDEEKSAAGNGIIYTGYNRCETFYEGIHAYESQNDPKYCISICTRCQRKLEGTSEHSFNVSESYAGQRYLSLCTITKECECGYDETYNVDALFVWKGYSCTLYEVNGAYSVAQGFFVNNEAISEYSKYLSMEYGLIAAVGGVDSEKTVRIPYDQIPHDYFEIKIVGISESKKDTDVIFCAYVLANEKTYYLDNNQTSETVTGASYTDILNISK